MLPVLLTFTAPPMPKEPTATVLVPNGSTKALLPELRARMPAEKKLLALPLAIVP